MEKKKIIAIYTTAIATIIFDICMSYICGGIVREYNEMVMEMPIAPKPNHLIENMYCVLLLICLANFGAALIICRNMYKSYSYSEYQKYLLKQIKFSKDDDKKKDVLELMLKNNNEIAEYFEISKKQEKFSYRVSMACAIIGAIILFSSIGAIVFNKGIEITVVTIISGSITELVSGVVLWIHNKSAMQLNFYYNSLHENEKVLSAINMVDRIEDKDKKQQMYEEIIKAQIRENEKFKENEK